MAGSDNAELGSALSADRAVNENTPHPDFRLGRLPRKSDPRSLIMANYLTPAREMVEAPPKATKFWTKRAAFPPETWGNDIEGCCTIASQANMFRRFERLESRNQTVTVPTESVHSVYRAMTQALYGGGDTGAYEEDALSWTRDPDKTVRDSKGHPLTNDAYIRVNSADQVEMRRSIAIAAGHGIKICINLPVGFQSLVDRHTKESKVDLDYPSDLTTGLTGIWLPGSWGGHSMFSIDYDEIGLWLEHTWGIPPQRITWRAAAAYIDEAHVVIDSVDSWRKKPVVRSGVLKLQQIVNDVNDVSSIKIAA